MKIVTISEAKSKLSALIDSAESGDQVLIMRGSHPAVVLTPINENDLHLASEFSLKTLESFEDEIKGERKAGKLTKLGRSSKEAAQTLKKLV